MEHCRQDNWRRNVNMGIVSVLLVGVAVAWLTCLSAAWALPDNRAYEMVTPVEKNGVDPGVAVSAPTGNVVDWEANGGLGDATSGGITLYQSQRTAGGWQTVALTPKPPTLLGLLQEQAPMFWTPDLSKTIYATPESYDITNFENGASNLYLQSPEGSLSWISQGTQIGSTPDEITFDGSTPEAEHVVFSTEESLVPQATGIEPNGYRPTDYLYERNVASGQTTLIDVDNSGNLLNPEGAILGNGNWLARGEPPAISYLPANLYGTTTNAISSDGSKIFFESPPPSLYEAELEPSFSQTVHLYMRDGSETVPIDNPAITNGPGARYEGASEDGSLVFFSSDEALGGDPYADKEIYEFDTSSRTVTPISTGEGSSDGRVLGITAIANDGSHVYFVAKGLLATNTNSEDQIATEGAPNLYVYDTSTHKTTFIATVSLKDAEAEPERPGPLTADPDYERAAVPTPDGSVLVFESSADLTGQNSSGYFEIYRYQADTGALSCVSCTPDGVTPTGSATMGDVGGGSYGPPGKPLAMSADGSRIFFDSPDALVPEAINGGEQHSSLFGTLSTFDVYEWENGVVSLISDGRSSTSSLLSSTTPSGNDVFFNTAASLVPQDTDGGERDIYDARVDGGFSASSGGASTPCDNGASCRGPIGPAPSFVMPSSASQGTENLAPQVKAKPKPKSTKSKPKSKKNHIKKEKKVKGKIKKSKRGRVRKQGRQS